MPVYEYGCESCGHKFEESYRINERKIPEESACPQCGEKQVKQLMSVCSCTFDLNVKPKGDFRERMQEIKKKFKYDRHAKIKDY